MKHDGLEKNECSVWNISELLLSLSETSLPLVTRTSESVQF